MSIQEQHVFLFSHNPLDLGLFKIINNVKEIRKKKKTERNWLKSATKKYTSDAQTRLFFSRLMYRVLFFTKF